jgi:hypothetical protein
MSTNLEWSKSGLTINTKVVSIPKAFSKTTFTVPDFVAIQSSYLALSLVDIAGQGSKGIRIVSVGNAPGQDGSTYLLRWSYFKTTKPDEIQYSSQEISFPFDITHDKANSECTYSYFLQEKIGNIVTSFKEQTIDTPANDNYYDLKAILDDGLLSKAE